MEMKSGQSIRLGSFRIAYHPEWSNTLPYVAYQNGTAGRHFATVSAACEYFGIPLYKWSEPS